MKKALFLVAVLLSAVVLAAQNPPTLKVDVRLVNMVTTVSDAKGRLISDLTADDFTVYEDGIPQKIVHFTQDRAVPVSVGLLLDTSGSMVGKMRTATEAINRFLDNIHKDDDIFLMTFSNDISVLQDSTNDRRRLSRALGSLRVGYGTRLYDAVERGLEKVQDGRHDKKAILVFSDGMDVGSRNATLPEVVQSLQNSEVLVYGLGTGASSYADPAEHIPFTLPTPAAGGPGRVIIRNPRTAPPRGGPAGPGANASGVNMTVLNELASNTGGHAFLVSSTFMDTGSSEIDEILNRIADELRSQYTLGYYPSSPDSGEFRSVRVVTRPEYTVRTRTGYQRPLGGKPANK